MAIFNSYVKLPEGTYLQNLQGTTLGFWMFLVEIPVVRWEFHMELGVLVVEFTPETVGCMVDILD